MNAVEFLADSSRRVDSSTRATSRKRVLVRRFPCVPFRAFLPRRGSTEFLAARDGADRSQVRHLTSKYAVRTPVHARVHAPRSRGGPARPVARCNAAARITTGYTHLLVHVPFLPVVRWSSCLSTSARRCRQAPFVREHHVAAGRSSSATMRSCSSSSSSSPRSSSSLLLSPDRAHKRTARDAPPSALENGKRGGNNLGTASSVIVVRFLLARPRPRDEVRCERAGERANE